MKSVSFEASSAEVEETFGSIHSQSKLPGSFGRRNLKAISATVGVWNGLNPFESNFEYAHNSKQSISNAKKGASGKVSSSGSSSRLELFEVPKILSLE